MKFWSISDHNFEYRCAWGDRSPLLAFPAGILDFSKGVLDGFSVKVKLVRDELPEPIERLKS